LQARSLAEADCVIEVHDARIPFSGRNVNFKQQVRRIAKEDICFMQLV